jgi:hypothetical protein
VRASKLAILNSYLKNTGRDSNLFHPAVTFITTIIIIIIIIINAGSVNNLMRHCNTSYQHAQYWQKKNT